MAVLRLLHYPPQPPDRGSPAIGAGEHTDYGSLTLLLTDEVGGLEVKRRDTSGEGGWIAAPHVPGAFICNVGDCLMRWTNDVYVSTPHRVVQSRRARALFRRLLLDPNPDALVACLPTCVSAGRPARYPRSTAPPIFAAGSMRPIVSAGCAGLNRRRHVHPGNCTAWLNRPRQG